MKTKRKIKLIEVIGDSALGGGPKHILGLLSSLDREEYECTLICPKGYLNDEARKLSRLNVINLDFKSKYDLISAYSLHHLIDKIRGTANDPFGPTIIHLHGPRAGFLGRIFKVHGAEYVYTEHIFDYGYRISNPINHYLQKKLLSRLNHKTDLIIAVSNSVKDYLVEHKMADSERVTVIPNGILKLISNKAKTEPDKNPVIGAIGQLNERKGVSYLIEAMPKIIEKVPEARLEIIGEGVERARLVSITRKLKLEKQVKLLGRKTDVDKYLKEWDILAVPSLNEPFGIVALEGFSAGIPVIASSVGGLKDIIKDGENGKLIKPADSEAIAEAVTGVLTDNRKYEKYAKNGLKRAKEFLWSDIGRVYEEVFENLVKD